MTYLHRIEKALCSLYVALTYPIIAMGNAWMTRIEGKEAPKPTVTEMGSSRGNSAQLDMLDRHQPEPTVADIRPAGMVKVHAMGPGGRWDELHDYPVLLLPKVPGIEIKDGRGE